MKLTLCIAQINYNSKNIREHLCKLKKIVNENIDCDLIVLPELILHGHPSVEKPEGFLYRRSMALYGQISNDFYEFIKKSGASVFFGEIKRRKEFHSNVATFIDSSSIQHYLKTHVHWTEDFVPGSRLCVFESKFARLGPTICFDAAFPEVWRTLSLMGAQVMVNISAVPTAFPTKYIYRRLQRAAINNQVFVVYANRAGSFFSGNSAVFDPRGEILTSAGEGEEIVRVEIDLNEIGRWREEERIYANRRPLLYKPIGSQQQAKGR